MCIRDRAMAVELVRVEPPALVEELLELALQQPYDCLLDAPFDPRSVPWGARGERVGEASNPGPPLQFKRQRVPSKHIAKPARRPRAPAVVLQQPMAKRRIPTSFISSAVQLAELLAADDSPFRLCPGDPQRLRELCEAAFELLSLCYVCSVIAVPNYEC
eukprot:TRINITY_DN2290_c0_g1_i4.p1 TRINITY_DN2290_c0_g1~~TRINITY_DN2290_c0_g1_i4.p1  ORF type:complete len:160 (-),score=41.05 TRINITY_DN2290_c0_g1_i4:165-644(-)